MHINKKLKNNFEDPFMHYHSRNSKKRNWKLKKKKTNI